MMEMMNSRLCPKQRSSEGSSALVAGGRELFLRQRIIDLRAEYLESATST